MVYRLGSSRVVSALTAAYKRGVVVRIATAHSQENIASQSAKPLKTLLDHATNGSSFTWTQGSARGSSTADGAVMHIKAYTFSRVGTGSDIVFTGSYNTADGADAATFARMLQVVGNNNLYQDYHTIFVQVVANKPVHHPFRSFAGSGWTAYFLPDNPISKSNDPALKRLNSLPAKAKTTIKIAMYSMWGSRGTWLADRLATIAKKGGHVTLVAGPDVASNIVRILRKAGVNVQGGCFTNGDFDHGKDMAATYLTGSGKSAKRVYWAWVGSDNWGTTSDDNDEATLGVQSKSLEDALASSIQTTANTGHSVSPGSKSCHPNPKG